MNKCQNQKCLKLSFQKKNYIFLTFMPIKFVLLSGDMKTNIANAYKYSIY